MKQIAVLALIGSVSAIDLKAKQRHRQGFIENPEQYEKEIWGGDDHMNMQSKADIQMQSDPIAGSLGFPNDDSDASDHGVAGVIEKDLASRRPIKYELDEGVHSTDDSISWAEKELGRKLVPYKPKTLAEAYDPSKAPSYPNPWNSYEDDDAAGTLKSAHLAEWIHGYHGYKHHDNFHVDQFGKRHYQRPDGAYEGAGHDHYGKGLGHGNYGKFNPDGEAKEGWGDSVGYYKGGEGDEGAEDKEGGDDDEEGAPKKKKASLASKPMRRWWTKLEKDPHNGMSARKEYDDVAGDLAESGQYDMKTLARILLERENAKQAQGVAHRLSKQEREDAKEVARALAGSEEARKQIQREREAEEEEELEKSTKKTKEAKAAAEKKEKEEKENQEKIDDEEREKSAKAAEDEEKMEEQAKKEVAEQLKAEKRDKNEEKAQGRKARADAALAENKEDLSEEKAEKYNKHKDIKKARESVEKGEKDDEEEKEEAREKAKEEDEADAAKDKEDEASGKKKKSGDGDGDDDDDKKPAKKTKLQQLQEREEADEKLKNQGIAELEEEAGKAEVLAKKRAAEEKKSKSKEDAKVKKALEKEDAAREEALEAGKEPPKPQGLAQQTDGPIIEGVPIENVNLPYLSGDAMDIDDPEPADMLQTGNLEQISTDEVLEEGSFVQMKLSNQSKLERIIRFEK